MACPQCGYVPPRPSQLDAHTYSYRCLKTLVESQGARKRETALLRRNAARTLSRQKPFQTFCRYLQNNMREQRDQQGKASFNFVPVPYGKTKALEHHTAVFIRTIKGALRRAGETPGTERWRQRAFASAAFAMWGYTARWVSLTAAPPPPSALGQGGDAEWQAYAEGVIRGMLYFRERQLEFANQSITITNSRSIMRMSALEATRASEKCLASLRVWLSGVAPATSLTGKAILWRAAHSVAGPGLPATGYLMEGTLMLAEGLGVFEDVTVEPGEQICFAKSKASGVVKGLAFLTGTDVKVFKKSSALVSLGVSQIERALDEDWRSRPRPRLTRQGVGMQICMWVRDGQGETVVTTRHNATGASPRFLPAGCLAEGGAATGPRGKGRISRIAEASLREARNAKRRRRA